VLVETLNLAQSINQRLSLVGLVSDVKSSRPKFWPRPRSFGLGLASISLSYYVIGYFSGKNRVKFGNFVNFSRNDFKSCVVNHYLVLFHNYFWPRPRSSVLGLEALASASRFWPRLTSLALVIQGQLVSSWAQCQTSRSRSSTPSHLHYIPG